MLNLIIIPLIVSLVIFIIVFILFHNMLGGEFWFLNFFPAFVLSAMFFIPAFGILNDYDYPQVVSSEVIDLTDIEYVCETGSSGNKIYINGNQEECSISSIRIHNSNELYLEKKTMQKKISKKLFYDYSLVIGNSSDYEPVDLFLGGKNITPHLKPE